MTLTFYAYQMPAFYTGQNTVGTLSPLGTIRLPLPNYMVDNQMVVYDQEALGLALGAGLNAAAQNGKLAGLGAGGTGALVQGAINAGNAVGSLVPSVGSSVVTPALQAQGFAVNPFLTVMFKTPAFKKHSLSWKLSPKNSAESQTLNTIVNTLRLHQLPSVNSGALLLQYPDIVQIAVSNVNPGQYFSYLFKRAVIEACSVNYTPNGQPAFFTGTNAPAEVEIALSILEIEMWLQQDYNGNQVAGTPAGVNLNGLTPALNTFTPGS